MRLHHSDDHLRGEIEIPVSDFSFEHTGRFDQIHQFLKQALRTIRFSAAGNCLIGDRGLNALGALLTIHHNARCCQLGPQVIR